MRTTRGIVRDRRDKVPISAPSESPEEGDGTSGGFKPLMESGFSGVFPMERMRRGEMGPVVYKARVWSKIHGFLDVEFSPEGSAVRR